MGTDARSADDHLKTLVAQAPTFDFFQAVRLLQLFDEADRAVAGTTPPDREPLRFRANLAPTFAASDVQAVEMVEGLAVPRMTVNFIGIANPASLGSLPPWYAETARLAEADRREPRPELRAFFDLFDDRLIGFVFRAWQKHFLPGQHDALHDGPPYRALLSMLGLGSDGLRGRLAVDERALVRYAAFLRRRPTTPAALVDALTDYFALPFSVVPFVGKRVRLLHQDQWRMGDVRFGLGVNTVLGSTVALPQSSFRVRVGPIDLTTFHSLLPRGSRHAALVDLVRFAVGAEFDFDIQLVLEHQSVPKLEFPDRTPRPGEDRDAARARADATERTMRLGWSTWLGIRQGYDDVDDAICPTSLHEGHCR